MLWYNPVQAFLFNCKEACRSKSQNTHGVNLMLGSMKKKLFWLSVALFALTVSTFSVAAQSTPVKPYLQPIAVQPSATPALVKKTSSVTPTGAPSADVVNPADAEIAIPGYSGILVETMDGKVVKENYADYTFNPASIVKVATSYAVLKTIGPDFRFLTNVYFEGFI